LRRLLFKNIYLKTLKEIYSILDPAQRKKSFLMIFFIIINGFIDVLGLAFILPVLYLANNSSAIHTNMYLNYFYTLFGFKNTDHFLLLLAVIMLLVFLIKNILGVLFNYLQSRFSFQIGTEITSRQFRQYLNRDFLYFKDTNSNVIMRKGKY